MCPSHRWLIVDEGSPNEWTRHPLTFFELAGERSIVLQSYAYEARTWGVVSRDAGAFQVHTVDGAVQTLDAACVVQYVGIETPIVVARCETGRLSYGTGPRWSQEGALMVWRVGERPAPFDDIALATFAEVDRNLLTLQGVRESLQREGLWHRVNARSPAEVRIRGFNMMRWSEDTHAWNENETAPDHTLPYGVLAWSEDGSALVFRTARRGGSICFGRSEPLPSQLGFTHLNRKAH